MDYYTLITKWARTITDSKLLAALNKQQKALRAFIDIGKRNTESFEQAFSDISETREAILALENECRRRKIDIEKIKIMGV